MSAWGHHPKQTISTVKHGGVDVMLLGCFFSAWTEKVLRVDEMMDKAKSRAKLEEKPLKVFFGLHEQKWLVMSKKTLAGSDRDWSAFTPETNCTTVCLEVVTWFTPGFT